MIYEKPLREQSEDTRRPQEESSDDLTMEDIQRTEAWLEEVEENARNKPDNPVAQVLARAGRKVLEKQKAEYQKKSQS